MILSAIAGSVLAAGLVSYLEGAHSNEPQRTIKVRIHDHADGHLVTRSGRTSDSPLGVDASLDAALGTAHREAIILAGDHACPVVIQRIKGARWLEVARVEPPTVI